MFDLMFLAQCTYIVIKTLYRHKEISKLHSILLFFESKVPRNFLSWIGSLVIKYVQKYINICIYFCFINSFGINWVDNICHSSISHKLLELNIEDIKNKWKHMMKLGIILFFRKSFWNFQKVYLLSHCFCICTLKLDTQPLNECISHQIQ